MNAVQEKKTVNYRKLFWIGVLIAVVAYAYGEPYLEKLTGWDLPSIRENNNNVVDLDPETKRTQNKRPDQGAPVSAKITNLQEHATLEKTKSNQSNQTSPVENHKPFLIPTGKKNRLRSPAGLIYGESRGEHRVDHVMRHASDDKNRPVHSVFEGSKEEILKILDEAFILIQANSDRVKSKPDGRLDFRIEHKVDMKRKIGYLGGQTGRRQNYPPRSKLTLVLDNGKFVVTAYPDR